MTRHKWASLRDEYLSTPEGRASVARAKARLEACWVVVCREDQCLWWVDANGKHRDFLTGVGPDQCPCKRNDPNT